LFSNVSWELNLDFCLSNDERIKSYMISNDWKDELYEANEQQWFVDRRKFDEEQIVKEYEYFRKKYFLFNSSFLFNLGKVHMFV
jgi:hypothetical protein